MSDALSIRAAAREAAEATALIVGGQHYSFAQLAERTRERLRALPAGQDGMAAPVSATNTLQTVVELYARLEARSPLLLLHPRLSAAERAAQQAAADIRIGYDGAAAVLFTSGTTGLPRAAVLTRTALLASAQASAANLGWRDDDCWLLAMSLARIGGLSILTRCLAARRTVALVSAFDPATLPQTIVRQNITLASLVPTMLARVLKANPHWTPPPFLRAILIGGAAASGTLLQRAHACRLPIIITYGCTESCSQVVATPYGGRFDAARFGAGRPLPGADVRIVDGRIQISGAMLMAGYLGEPPLPPGAWFDTGDLGRIDADGCLHVEGRRADLIVSGGENVSPLEVEHVLESFPGVAAAGVFGIADETWGQLVAAAVVADARRADPDALARYLAECLSPHKRPRRICFVESLPQTGAGKLDRTALGAFAPRLQALAAGDRSDS